MRGLPKWLNSKDDYLYIRDNYPRDQWLPKFQELLDSRSAWFNMGEVVGDGITDSTHKVIEIGSLDAKKYQYELVDNPDCMLYKLGFSVEEVEGLIGG